MELKHLTIAVATALGLSTAAMAQTGDMGKQRGTPSEPSASATQGMASSDDVRQVQQELQNRGFNVGTVDGVMGPQPRAPSRNSSRPRACRRRVNSTRRRRAS